MPYYNSLTLICLPSDWGNANYLSYFWEGVLVAKYYFLGNLVCQAMSGTSDSVNMDGWVMSLCAIYFLDCSIKLEDQNVSMSTVLTSSNILVSWNLIFLEHLGLSDLV